MKYDPDTVLRAQQQIRQVGYATFNTTGTIYAQQAAKELSKGCPGAKLEYLFASDDLFVDTTRWPHPNESAGNWDRLVKTAAEGPVDAAPLSPTDFGINGTPRK